MGQQLPTVEGGRRYGFQSLKARAAATSFDAGYAAHAVCACGHEMGYHDGEHCSGVHNCDCRGFRRVA